jgi:hypothetical protein
MGSARTERSARRVRCLQRVRDRCRTLVVRRVARQATLSTGCGLTYVAADRALVARASRSQLLNALQLNVGVRWTQTLMKTVLRALLLLTTLACTADTPPAQPCLSVHGLLTNTSLRLSPEALEITPDTALWAPEAPVQVRVHMPPGTRCSTDRDTVLGPLGRPVRLTGAIYTADGVRHPLRSFIGEADCQVIALFVDLPTDTSRRVTRVDLASQDSLDVPRAEWGSGGLCMDLTGRW